MIRFSFLLFVVLALFLSPMAEDFDLSTQGGDAGNLAGETVGWNPAEWNWWKATKEGVTDIYDRATHSRIAKGLVFWYGVAKEYAVSINKQYDNFMRALNIINRELVFIERFAVKVENIKNRGWSTATFWDNMAELEDAMDQMESMGDDLKEFDRLVRANRTAFRKIAKWKPPSWKKACEVQRKMWGGIPDNLAKDPKYSLRPDVRILNANAFSFTRNYATQGSTMQHLYDEAEKADSNNKAIDTLSGSPSNVLAFQNAYLCNDLMTRAIYLGQVKDKLIATCNAINAQGAMDEIADIYKYKAAKDYEELDYESH